jgi:uncharacterized protein
MQGGSNVITSGISILRKWAGRGVIWVSSTEKLAGPEMTKFQSAFFVAWVLCAFVAGVFDAGPVLAQSRDATTTQAVEPIQRETQVLRPQKATARQKAMLNRNKTAAVQAKAQPQSDRVRQQINGGTVSIISGNPNGAYLYFAHDMAAVLDDGDNLRVLPVVGKGGAQNIRDVLYLRGIDMGFLRSDALQLLDGTPGYPNLGTNLRYITKLYNEEMHVLARKDIKSIQELTGKVVNYSDAGSGTDLSTTVIFDKLGIKPEKRNMGQRDAFEAMKSGKIDATVLIAGKPLDSFRTFEAGDQFHLLPVPFEPALIEDYLPTTITHEDYPKLLKPGETLETVGASVILGVYNWPEDSEQYAKLERFVNKFFSSIDKFGKPPRQAKWKEVNIAAVVPGLERFQPAQEWLDRQPKAQADGPQDELKQEFAAFLAEAATKPDLKSLNAEELFSDFMRWREQKGE